MEASDGSGDGSNEALCLFCHDFAFVFLLIAAVCLEFFGPCVCFPTKASCWFCGPPLLLLLQDVVVVCGYFGRTPPVFYAGCPMTAGTRPE